MKRNSKARSPKNFAIAQSLSTDQLAHVGGGGDETPTKYNRASHPGSYTGSWC